MPARIRERYARSLNRAIFRVAHSWSVACPRAAMSRVWSPGPFTDTSSRGHPRPRSGSASAGGALPRERIGSLASLDVARLLRRTPVSAPKRTRCTICVARQHRVRLGSIASPPLCDKAVIVRKRICRLRSAGSVRKPAYVTSPRVRGNVGPPGPRPRRSRHRDRSGLRARAAPRPSPPALTFHRSCG